MNYKKLSFILGCGIALSLGKANAQSATFIYTGSTQTWTVPCGVSSITVDMAGAQGGSISNLSQAPTTAAGGLGGRVQCTLPVTAGAVLQINVGGQGESDGLTLSCQVSAGGWNGGGTGYGGYNSYNYNAGGGGGASSILQTPYGCANTMVNAGGGGGAACSGCTGAGVVGGAGGGLVGGTGGYNACQNAAYGGTQSVGGAAATTFGAGVAGSACTGGNSSTTGVTCGGGGGGGGGYYGGGGGSLSGGGGGSSYTMAGALNITHTQGYQSGNGYVTLTWIPIALTVTGNVIENVTCNGGDTGRASAVVSGGSVPYTYSWTPSGGSGDTASGLTAGTYIINITDACGSTASASVSITQPSSIAVTAYPLLNDSCNGDDGGSAMSSVSGGSMPYIYAWTGGGTKDSIVGLTAGTYTLNIQDANGCTGSATVTITQPNMLVVSASVTANVLCNGGNTGSASSNVSGGTTPYYYLWSSGGGTNSTVSGLTAGTYTLSVQDANGCTGTATVAITQPAALAIVPNSSPDNGGNDGKAWVSVSGGVSPYSYLWTGGNTTDSISGKDSGMYCCRITDANGCKDSVCIAIGSTLGIGNIASGSRQIMVYPNPNNGQFTIQSSVGSGQLSVEVYNVLGEKVFSGNLNPGNNTINMSNQSNGIYLYRVMSENGTLVSEGKITLQK